MTNMTPPRPTLRARNTRRLRCPRKRSIIARTYNSWFQAREWVERHITARDLYRQLDALRHLAPPEPTDWDAAEGLRRLRREWAHRDGRP